MNVSLAPHAAAGAAGAHGKSVKGADPLADFMAMLTQLGITVEDDGTLAASATPAAPGAEDIAAKLLAKLGKKGADASQKEKPGDALPELAAGERDSKQDDPVTTLADLLAQIDTAAPKGGETAKPDVATLIAAVRAFVASSPKPVAGDTIPVDPATPKVEVAAASTPSIAALLTRGSRIAGSEAPKPVAPGTVQSTFARLETLVSDKSDSAHPSEGKPLQADDTGAPDTPVADQAAASEKAGPTEKGASATKLTELLARLTASIKPGAGQPQAATNTPATTYAARPQVDPQLAAIAHAIQNMARDDRTASDDTDVSADGAALGLPTITPQGAPTATGARTEALPTDTPQANPAEELVKHHLDLARDTQWLDTLARDIARATQANAHLRFQLNPEHLGSLKVELLNGANGTSVKLTADTEAARAILADAQPRLVAEARAQGLRISEAHVDLSGHGGGQRHMTEAPVVIRTANGAAMAEVEQDKPAASGERYA